MLTQTLAIFLDAYRELNAKKLFWITLVLSAVIVVALGAVGIDDRGVSLFVWRLDWFPVNSNLLSPKMFYTSLFNALGISLWLRWIATILALVSTAGIVPDLISGGTIETVLSKPISRVRLLLTKLATGLLFVTLQVGVFSLGCFLVFGFRAGVWNFGLFLAVPIMVLFYSYLFSIMALLGMITRSTVASLLLTALLWGCLIVINLTDFTMTSITVHEQMTIEQRTARIELMEKNTAKLIVARRTDAGDQGPPTHEQILAENPFLSGQYARLEHDQKTLGEIRFWSRLVWGVKLAMPKTGETISLLDRYLIDPDSLPRPESQPQSLDFENPDADVEVDRDEFGQRVDSQYRSRPLWWVVGTSLVFEAVLLGLSCLIFKRRDF